MGDFSHITEELQIVDRGLAFRFNTERCVAPEGEVPKAEDFELFRVRRAYHFNKDTADHVTLTIPRPECLVLINRKRKLVPQQPDVVTDSWCTPESLVTVIRKQTVGVKCTSNVLQNEIEVTTDAAKSMQTGNCSDIILKFDDLVITTCASTVRTNKTTNESDKQSSINDLLDVAKLAHSNNICHVEFAQKSCDGFSPVRDSMLPDYEQTIQARQKACNKQVARDESSHHTPSENNSIISSEDMCNIERELIDALENFDTQHISDDNVCTIDEECNNMQIQGLFDDDTNEFSEEFVVCGNGETRHGEKPAQGTSTTVESTSNEASDTCETRIEKDFCRKSSLLSEDVPNIKTNTAEPIVNATNIEVGKIRQTPTTTCVYKSAAEEASPIFKHEDSVEQLETVEENSTQESQSHMEEISCKANKIEENPIYASKIAHAYPNLAETACKIQKDSVSDQETSNFGGIVKEEAKNFEESSIDSSKTAHVHENVTENVHKKQANSPLRRSSIEEEKKFEESSTDTSKNAQKMQINSVSEQNSGFHRNVVKEEEQIEENSDTSENFRTNVNKMATNSVFDQDNSRFRASVIEEKKKIEESSTGTSENDIVHNLQTNSTPKQENYKFPRNSVKEEKQIEEHSTTHVYKINTETACGSLANSVSDQEDSPFHRKTIEEVKKIDALKVNPHQAEKACKIGINPIMSQEDSGFHENSAEEVKNIEENGHIQQNSAEKIFQAQTNFVSGQENCFGEKPIEENRNYAPKKVSEIHVNPATDKNMDEEVEEIEEKLICTPESHVAGDSSVLDGQNSDFLANVDEEMEEGAISVSPILQSATERHMLEAHNSHLGENTNKETAGIEDAPISSSEGIQIEANTLQHTLDQPSPTAQHRSEDILIPSANEEVTKIEENHILTENSVIHRSVADTTCKSPISKPESPNFCRNTDEEMKKIQDPVFIEESFTKHKQSVDEFKETRGNSVFNHNNSSPEENLEEEMKKHLENPIFTNANFHSSKKSEEALQDYPSPEEEIKEVKIEDTESVKESQVTKRSSDFNGGNPISEERFEEEVKKIQEQLNLHVQEMQDINHFDFEDTKKIRQSPILNACEDHTKIQDFLGEEMKQLEESATSVNKESGASMKCELFDSIDEEMRRIHGEPAMQVNGQGLTHIPKLEGDEEKVRGLVEKIDDQDEEMAQIRDTKRPVILDMEVCGCLDESSNDSIISEQRLNVKALNSKENVYKKSASSDASARTSALIGSAIGGNSNRQLYKCNRCDFKAHKESYLKLHLRLHLLPYGCNVCSETFPEIVALQQHAKRCHGLNGKKPVVASRAGEKLYKCGFCDYITSYINRLQCHVKVHQKKLHECDKCEFSTFSKWTLKRHTSDHCGKQELYECDECGYISMYRDRLELHQRLHSGKKLYKCDVCSFSTAHIGYFNAHRGFHESSVKKESLSENESETKYKCDECDYCTLQRAALSRHATKCGHQISERSLALQMQRLKCTECGFVARTYKALKKHITTHTNLKPCKYKLIDKQLELKVHNNIKQMCECDKLEHNVTNSRSAKQPIFNCSLGS